MDAHLLEQPAFFWCSCGGEDFCADLLCDLDGGHADTAGAGVDEDALALAHVGKVPERVVGGEEDGRQGCGFDKADVLWLAEDHVAVDGDVAAEAVRCHASDVVTGAEIHDIFADAHDGPGEIVAEPADVDRVAGVHPERLHDVAEVDAAGFD